jgi:acyl transferase domain-containing protein/NADPH:quinone reductase-like Zn-dependent oxidoreductase/acyl carrier protein
MDPQQRLLLEASWEALEDAGLNPKALSGQAAGVFIGISNSEYAQLLQQILPAEQLSAYVLQGSALNATAGRLSYFYGLNGPSLAIDTACSSSLVAVDRACRSLREGETELAVAAGVNIVALPEPLIIASQWGMLSVSGKVRAFDALADGFVRGEGCGVLVLKRLSLAQRDGDRIVGVILGSAVNQDGASSGLTVPNGLAQQALLREAHRRAGIEAWQVGYVEAHGTGTSLGDPIEAEALGAVFGEGRPRERKLPIGSVKTNIGHLESAAGVAGLIKLLLGLEHGMVPTQLHWERPSEHVRWSELPLEVVTEPRAWEPIAGRRIGGVSSFGFSGTNAHVIVEGWPRTARLSNSETGKPAEPREEVLLITARTEAALRALVERYAAFLPGSGADWSDICYTSAVGRAVFAQRLAVVAEDKGQAAAKLLGWLRGESGEGVFHGVVSAGSRAGAEALDPAATNAEIAAQLVRGVVMDWAARFADRGLHRVALPTYAFQRERYWIEAPSSPQAETGEPTGQALLGRRLPVAGVRAQFASVLSAEGWIGEHVVQGRVVLPATGHLELMLEAGVAAFAQGCALEDVVLQSPLAIDGRRRVQAVVEEESGGRSRVRLYAEAKAEETKEAWERVSEGWLLRDAIHAQPSEILELEAIRDRLQPRHAEQSFYAEMSARGLEFGERFRGVRQLWSGEAEALGEIVEIDSATSGFQVPPWWLDACLQVAGAIGGGEDDSLYLPMSLGRIDVYPDPHPTAASGRQRHAASTWSHITTQRIDAETLVANVTVTDQDGYPILHIANLRFRKAGQKRASSDTYTVKWIEAPGAAPIKEIRGHWIVLSNQDSTDSLGAEVCRMLKSRGADCSFILASESEVTTGQGTYLLRGAEVHSTRKVLREIASATGPLEGLLDLRCVESQTLTFLEGREAPDILPALEGSLSLLQAILLEQLLPTRGLWLVTRQAWSSTQEVSAEGRAIQAFRRTAALEYPELRIKSLDLDSDSSGYQLLRAIEVADADEIRLDSDRILVPRLVKVAEPFPNSQLVAAESGLIEEIQSIAASRVEPKDDEVEIDVQANGLNFRDVMNSLGMLPGSGPALGGECSGVVVSAGSSAGLAVGERVFAFAPGCFKQFVTVNSADVAKVPDGMSLAQAAGLPVVYLTAMLGLQRLARLQPGESILIHSAAGGLGLAALYVARHLGATVYATAGSEEKRAYLNALGIEHVYSSRTPEFSGEILRVTEGRGVDVVLNSLTGTLAEATLSALAAGGRFLEVGKRDTLSREVVQRKRPDVGHFVYDLGEEAAADRSLVPALMQQLLRSLANGAIPALPVTEFTDPKEAFRFMAQARHVGKIVVNRANVTSRAHPMRIDPDATYLITGGCGGLGQIFAAHLLNRGARHLVLMGRSHAGAAAANIERMRAQGASITVATADVSDRIAVQSVLDQIPANRPLRGILHTAGVIRDHSLLEMDVEAIRAVLLPKWQGAWNLHQLTRNLPLDFLVFFSSAAGLLGSPGQTNYAAANGALDALADYRHALGLPAVSIQWGPWSAAGMTANWSRDLRKIGLEAIEPRDGLRAFDALLSGTRAVAAVLPVLSWQAFMRQQALASRELLSLLTDTSPRQETAAIREKKQYGQFHQALRLASAGQRKDMLAEHLREQTLKILALPPQTRVDENEALHDLGLDSLMAVELRNVLMASLELQLPPTMVLDHPTLRHLTEFLFGQIAEVIFSEMEPLSPKASSRGNDIATMSEEEAEALLLEELGRQEYGAGR